MFVLSFSRSLLHVRIWSPQSMGTQMEYTRFLQQQLNFKMFSLWKGLAMPKMEEDGSKSYGWIRQYKTPNILNKVSSLWWLQNWECNTHCHFTDGPLCICMEVLGCVHQQECLHNSAIAQNFPISLQFTSSSPAASSLRHVFCAHLCRHQSA